MATIYVNSTTGNDTTGTGAAGAPFASPGKAASVAVSNDVIEIASGTYLITTTTKNVPGGRVSPASGVIMRGVGPTRPILRASGVSSFTILSSPNPSEKILFEFLELDGDGLSNVHGYMSEGGSVKFTQIIDCVFRNLSKAVAEAQTDTSIVRCFATNCTGSETFVTNANATYVDCVSYNNGGSGFGGPNGQSRFVRCIASHNGGSGFQFNNNNNGISVNCVSYKNAVHGFSSEGGSALGQVLLDGIGYGNTHWGLATESNNISTTLGLATGSNGSGAYNSNSTKGILKNHIALSADPFTDGDRVLTSVEDAHEAFSLNNVSGGGALLRGAGYLSHLDMGAVQSESGSGSGGSSAPRGVLSMGGLLG
jgi:hypothetical protein